MAQSTTAREASFRTPGLGELSAAADQAGEAISFWLQSALLGAKSGHGDSA
jgi:hypothetical protein